MLNIAIVDDEQVHRDILVKYIEEWIERQHYDTQAQHCDTQVQAFASSEAFYFAWCGDQRYDVLFLDIMMGGADGISLAKRLREQGKDLIIIFTTGIADYMQQGYDLEAMHYLLKPLDREKVWECLEKCMKRRGEDAKWILLPAEEGWVKTDASKILYAEAIGHYCRLECMEERLQLKLGIRELARKLEETGDFLFCHRSYLVNLRRVAKVGRQDIVMDGGAHVPVSRRLYNEVNDSFIRTFVNEKSKTGENI